MLCAARPERFEGQQRAAAITLHSCSPQRLARNCSFSQLLPQPTTTHLFTRYRRFVRCVAAGANTGATSHGVQTGATGVDAGAWAARVEAQCSTSAHAAARPAPGVAGGFGGVRDVHHHEGVPAGRDAHDFMPYWLGVLRPRLRRPGGVDFCLAHSAASAGGPPTCLLPVH